MKKKDLEKQTLNRFRAGADALGLRRWTGLSPRNVSRVVADRVDEKGMHRKEPLSLRWISIGGVKQ